MLPCPLRGRVRGFRGSHVPRMEIARSFSRVVISVLSEGPVDSPAPYQHSTSLPCECCGAPGRARLGGSPCCPACLPGPLPGLSASICSSRVRVCNPPPLRPRLRSRSLAHACLLGPLPGLTASISPSRVRVPCCCARAFAPAARAQPRSTLAGPLHRCRAAPWDDSCAGAPLSPPRLLPIDDRLACRPASHSAIGAGPHPCSSLSHPLPSRLLPTDRLACRPASQTSPEAPGQRSHGR